MRLKTSIDEILAYNDAPLASSFYGLLFDQHPDLKEFFAETNMQRQQLMLTMTLQIVAYHHRTPNPAMRNFIKELGKSHQERGIAREDLSKFRDVLLMAIGRFHGNDWSDELADEWSNALDGAIELMSASTDADG